MRILHIFPGSFGHLFARDYIRFIREYFGSSNSFSVIKESESTSKNPLLSDIDNIEYLDIYSFNLVKIKRYFLKYDKIIFHSLSVPPLIMLLFMIQPSLMKRFVWVAWGYDLYNWKIKNANLKGKIVNTVGNNFRKRTKHFVGLFPPDIDFFKKAYNPDAQVFYATYVDGLYNPIYKKELNLMSLAEKKRNNISINIQVGHSCDPGLNHIQVLQDISKFKNENIRVYLPLSYGDKQIGDQIEEKAKEIFGEKAICIRELMEKDKYMDFLANIDIAIFNIQRQIGLGNLGPLRYMEKKIYMPAGSPMYEYFKSQGINICDYYKIATMDFDSFTEPVDMKKAKELIQSKATNIDQKIEMWKKVFDASLEKGK
jgi:dTDP-N-acetylfucosamine:lipid II N-acetylfucosaminyltransferase